MHESMEEISAPHGVTDTPREDPASDAYEVFVAELQARRERLRQLLDAVTREAARCARPRPAATPRPRRHCRCAPGRPL